ncbi:galactose-specific C-type lectin, putative [Anopheles sinensis]|uniref:Galactose-specific C-type lectin, putative n=1 Tax=Anopheles sinensis TaxID=74873 RepID=A0A084VWW4_ANOSI|nr:galactose-specific C-type lectin, putative [Anopheles sinensis]
MLHGREDSVQLDVPSLGSLKDANSGCAQGRIIGYFVISAQNETVTSSDQLMRCDSRVEAKRYIVFNDVTRTFFEAWRFCASMGLRLATVSSLEESRLLEQAVDGSTGVTKGYTWWIGGTDLGREGTFVWISTNIPVGYKTGYSNFSPGQPDNTKKNEHCLEIGRFGKVLWNDMPCETKLRCICEDAN